MMKILHSILFSLILNNSLAQSADGIQFSHGTWSEIKQIAKEQNKAIFIDCYTAWCGPCKMLSRDVFPQKKVGELFNNNFINYKIDMEKGEGPKLKELFNVKAFPTLIWVDANGNELHKTVGAPKANDLIKTAQLVIDGKGLVDLKRKYEADSDNYQTMLLYIEALNNAYEKEKIQEVLNFYFKGNKGKALLNQENYYLIKNFLSNIYSPAFIWFDKHQEEFKTSYNAKEVEQKLYKTYLGYGHALVKKGGVDNNAIEQYKKTLKKRDVLDRHKMMAFVQESIYRNENNWDAYINKVNNNLEMGYHDNSNSFLYYNWAKAIDNGENAKQEHYLQAAQWMEKAFEVSQWPLENNIVYLEEKLKIMRKAIANDCNIKTLEQRIEDAKRQVAN